MIYNETNQHSSLNNDIKRFWVLEEDHATYNAEALIPDSTIELAIVCTAPLTLKTNDIGTELPRIFIKGLHQKPLHLRVTGQTAQILCVSMNGWCLPMLPDVSFSHLGQAIIPLNGIWSDCANHITKTVCHFGYEEAIFQLQQFIEDRIQAHSDLNPIRDIGHRMIAAHGKVSIHELVADSHFSLSQIERRFKQAAGITLKTYARLIRFETARNRLHMEPPPNLADLALDLGYSDQAHFTHDFRAIADCTPGAYLNRVATQSADFLQDQQLPRILYSIRNTQSE